MGRDDTSPTHPENMFPLPGAPMALNTRENHEVLRLDAFAPSLHGQRLDRGHRRILRCRLDQLRSTCHSSPREIRHKRSLELLRCPFLMEICGQLRGAAGRPRPMEIPETHPPFAGMGIVQWVDGHPFVCSQDAGGHRACLAPR